MASTETPVDPTGRTSLWFGLLGGHAGWTVQLLVSYFVVALGCVLPFDFEVFGMGGLRFTLLAISMACGALAVAATVVAFRTWRRAGTGDPAGGLGLASGRSGFMALAGWLLSGLFVAVIVANATVLMLDPYLNPSCP